MSDAAYFAEWPAKFGSGPVGLPPKLHFSAADSNIANREWGANCGPHSIAAAGGHSLAEVHRVIHPFKGWMSPTMVTDALTRLGWSIQIVSGLQTPVLVDGINRVQFEGPWLSRDVPVRVAYQHTHWVAYFQGWVLCTCCEYARWIPEAEWRASLRTNFPALPFHITHHYRLTARAARGR